MGRKKRTELSQTKIEHKGKIKAREHKEKKTLPRRNCGDFKGFTKRDLTGHKKRWSPIKLQKKCYNPPTPKSLTPSPNDNTLVKQRKRQNKDIKLQKQASTNSEPVSIGDDVIACRISNDINYTDDLISEIRVQQRKGRIPVQGNNVTKIHDEQNQNPSVHVPLPIDQIVGNTSHVINTDDLQSPSVIGEHQIDRVGVDNVIENHDERNQDPKISSSSDISEKFDDVNLNPTRQLAILKTRLSHDTDIDALKLEIENLEQDWNKTIFKKRQQLRQLKRKKLAALARIMTDSQML